MSTSEQTRHIDQGIPIEWEGFRHAGETLIAHDVPEHTAELYRVVGTTRNPRVIARADAVLYEGNIVTPYLQDGHRILLQHCYAGQKARLTASVWLDEPVVLLELCESDDLSNVDTQYEGGADGS